MAASSYRQFRSLQRSSLICRKFLTALHHWVCLRIFILLDWQFKVFNPHTFFVQCNDPSFNLPISLTIGNTHFLLISYFAAEMCWFYYHVTSDVRLSTTDFQVEVKVIWCQIVDDNWPQDLFELMLEYKELINMGGTSFWNFPLFDLFNSLLRFLSWWY